MVFKKIQQIFNSFFFVWIIMEIIFNREIFLSSSNYPSYRNNSERTKHMAI